MGVALPALDNSRAEFSGLLTTFYNEFEAILLFARDRQHDSIGNRLVVRSAVSIIEGMCYRMKDYAIAAADTGLISLSDLERDVASEMIGDLNDKGDVDPKRLTLKPRANVLFSFRVFARAMGVEHSIDTSKLREWQMLIDTFKLRNDFVHAKTAAELEATRDHGQKASLLVAWFTGQISFIINNRTL